MAPVYSMFPQSHWAAANWLQRKFQYSQWYLQQEQSYFSAGLFKEGQSNQRIVQEGQMPMVQSTQAASSCNAVELLNEAGVHDTSLNQYRVKLYCAPSAKDVERHWTATVVRSTWSRFWKACVQRAPLGTACWPAKHATAANSGDIGQVRELVLMHSTQALTPSLIFVTPGGFDTRVGDHAYAWSITGGHGTWPQEALQFKGNHEEADTRVWFHAFAFA